MAAKTKTTRASSKTTKKGIFRKINFSSRKTQFLATILIVAVAGAGYFTYQSFASTIIAATRSNGNLYATNAYGVNEASKNGIPVWQLRPGGSAYADFTVPGGKSIKYCVMAKSAQPSQSVIVASLGLYSDYGPVSISTAYAQQCMTRKPYGGTTNVRVSLGASTGASTPLLSISQISAEILDTAPAPTPSK